MHKHEAGTSARKYTRWEYVAAGALVLGALGVGTQSADASVKWTEPLAHSALRAEAPWIRHNTGLRGRMTISCRHSCTIHAYSRRTGKLRFTLRVSVKHVRSHAFRVYEDYSGWFRHDGETYYLDPPCQPASPCVDG